MDDLQPHDLQPHHSPARHSPENTPSRFVVVATLFELALGVVAAAFGWLTGLWPWATLTSLDARQWWLGAFAGTAVALALFAAIVLADRRPVGLFRQLQRTVRQLVLPLFRSVTSGGLLLISLAAGVGEELLFRGCVQTTLVHWLPPHWGVWAAVLIASALFGVCHWVSWAYAIVAAGMGVVLGVLFLLTGNLVAPIVAHALYDFLALVYLTRASRS